MPFPHPKQLRLLLWLLHNRCVTTPLVCVRAPTKRTDPGARSGQASSISVGGNANRCLTVFVAIFICAVVGYGLQFGGTGAAMAIAWVFSVLGSCIAFAVVWAARREIRTRQKIQGTELEDCCALPSPCTLPHHQTLVGILILPKPSWQACLFGATVAQFASALLAVESRPTNTHQPTPIPDALRRILNSVKSRYEGFW